MTRATSSFIVSSASFCHWGGDASGCAMAAAAETRRIAKLSTACMRSTEHLVLSTEYGPPQTKHQQIGFTIPNP